MHTGECMCWQVVHNVPIVYKHTWPTCKLGLHVGHIYMGMLSASFTSQVETKIRLLSVLRMNARGFGPFPVRPQDVSALSRFGPGGFGPNVKFSVFSCIKYRKRACFFNNLNGYSLCKYIHKDHNPCNVRTVLIKCFDSSNQ